MTDDKRTYPLFSLCGLNCGLCPRYQTTGISKCPGCGGSGFHLKHPTCAVITCNKQHDNVEYCFQCSAYPCKRYSETGKADSFITYRNVLTDFHKADKMGIAEYQGELNAKIEILESLIKHYNDGRKKNFYCIAVNLFPLPDLKSIMEQIDTEIKSREMDMKNKIKAVVGLFESEAQKGNIDLKLRK